MPGHFSGDVLAVERFRQIFDLVVAHHIQQSPLTVADITKVLGRTASSVHDQVGRLQKEGLIVTREAHARSRYVTPSEEGLRRADLLPREACSVQSFPLSSGYEADVPVFSATCGLPRYASGEYEWLAPHHLFPKYRDGDRIVLAEGDSMVAPANSDEAKLSIYDSDLVWARDDVATENGARVLAEYKTASGEHECTIKLFDFDSLTGVVTLRPLNRSYPLIMRPVRDVEVHSVVLGVRRLIGGETK